MLEHADRLNNSTWCLRAAVERRPPTFRSTVPISGTLRRRGRPFVPAPGHVCPWSLAVIPQNAPAALCPSRRRSSGRGRRSGLSAQAPCAGAGRSTSARRRCCVSAGIRSRWFPSVPPAIDLDALEQFGIDFAQLDILLLRSKTHFRAVFEPMAAAIVIVDTPDWGTAGPRCLALPPCAGRDLSSGARSAFAPPLQSGCACPSARISRTT